MDLWGVGQGPEVHLQSPPKPPSQPADKAGKAGPLAPRLASHFSPPYGVWGRELEGGL